MGPRDRSNASLSANCNSQLAGPLRHDRVLGHNDIYDAGELLHSKPESEFGGYFLIECLPFLRRINSEPITGIKSPYFRSLTRRIQSCSENAIRMDYVPGV